MNSYQNDEEESLLVGTTQVEDYTPSRSSKIMLAAISIAAITLGALGVYSTPALSGMPLSSVSDLATFGNEDTGVFVMCPGDKMEKGDNYFSYNGKILLTMQSDGNLVIYSRYTNRAIWASGTNGGWMKTAGEYFIYQNDGNLVIYDHLGKPKWSPNTFSGDYLILQNDGNLVKYDIHGVPKWASNSDQGIGGNAILGNNFCVPTMEPVAYPTMKPIAQPTKQPTDAPVALPTDEPTDAPVSKPTQHPSFEPTKEPIAHPTFSPTLKPSHMPTLEPTDHPTFFPTLKPTPLPTDDPTHVPTISPTDAPTDEPTKKPSHEPTHAPTDEPTYHPTEMPVFPIPDPDAPVPAEPSLPLAPNPDLLPPLVAKEEPIPKGAQEIVFSPPVPDEGVLPNIPFPNIPLGTPDSVPEPEPEVPEPAVEPPEEPLVGKPRAPVPEPEEPAVESPEEPLIGKPRAPAPAKPAAAKPAAAHPAAAHPAVAKPPAHNMCSFTFTKGVSSFGAPKGCTLLAEDDLSYLKDGEKSKAFYGCATDDSTIYITKDELMKAGLVANGKSLLTAIFPGESIFVTFYTNSDFTGYEYTFNSNFHQELTRFHFAGTTIGNDQVKSVKIKSLTSSYTLPKECEKQFTL